MTKTDFKKLQAEVADKKWVKGKKKSLGKNSNMSKRRVKR